MTHTHTTARNESSKQDTQRDLSIKRSPSKSTSFFQFSPFCFRFKPFSSKCRLRLLQAQAQGRELRNLGRSSRPRSWFETRKTRQLGLDERHLDRCWVCLRRCETIDVDCQAVDSTRLFSSQRDQQVRDHLCWSCCSLPRFHHSRDASRMQNWEDCVKEASAILLSLYFIQNSCSIST